MIGARLTMRAQLARNATVAKDSWGQAAAPDYEPIGDPLPCFVYSNSAVQLADGQKFAEVEQLRAMFALGDDVRPEDRLASVTDRKGAQIIAGPLELLGPVQRKHTHLECALRRVG